MYSDKGLALETSGWVGLISSSTDYFFYFTHRRVSGLQQLNEWTDILLHDLHSSAPSDKNSFESNSHKEDNLKKNKDMAKVLVNLM